ncbi:autotransporter outer membrane beta-barrel domain-containing protein [Pseudomonas sp. CAN2814]|uniref:autotransporter family protein n=1 Tax=Pseudomonas sp. CAN1 TaxID=3046726 RepID=UPI002648F3D1|nr:autotransporter outer membrane beta-barrel domain-containing protein [Pseudomonas sp. CAN1]MDN6859861.1 autotransporter outer membrane beta-barrel domain-containing protein [Pseudomonas sp. CAN1]
MNAVLPLTFLLPGSEPRADCSLSPGPGNDAHVCSSGTATSLTDPSGDNSLSFPAGGTGTITGSVTFGNGADSVVMDSGNIGGGLSQGGGADSFRMSAGIIQGAVSQGDGVDDFVMTGGSIGSLAQGDQRDFFSMSGGIIIGAFEDGDTARMSGGTIGRVDMKLDNNLFDMSGGAIIGNLVTGFGQDTVILSAGSIGGNVSLSGGDDSMTITGGGIRGQVLLSFGNDRLTWDGGGTVRSAIFMGDGDDTALLRNLSETQLSSTPSVDGGPGNDSLTFVSTRTNRGGRYVGWENIALTGGSRLDLNDILGLGDAGSGTGSLLIDSSSLLTSSRGRILPFTASSHARLVNAGVIDLTASGARVDDRLTINGDYQGENGTLRLQSVLAGDDAPSDRLVVNQGSISGNTQLAISNLGGAGALTELNGIQVVEAGQGAVSSNDAFHLAQGLSVGPYQYYLFKGGYTAGSENSWYLRSSVANTPEPPVAPPEPPVSPPEPPVAPPEPPVEPPAILPEQPENPPGTPPEPPPTAAVTAPPEPPVAPPAQPGTPPAPLEPAATAPVAAPGTPALPTPSVGEAITIYRPEVPLYSAVPPVAALLVSSAIGTFHERQGEQSLLGETGAVPAGWVRVMGQSLRQSWAGTVSPSFDGNLDGFQVGHDLFGLAMDNGYTQRAGLFVGHSSLDGDVKGFSLGFENRHSGDLDLDGDSLGAYWTLSSPTGGYLDLVAMGTRLDGRSRSDRGYKIDLDGHAWAVSAEAGQPFPVSPRWVVEPQAQLIVQKVSLDSDNDGISHIAFDTQEQYTGRVGARLKGRYLVNGTALEPWLRTNLWHNFGGRDAVVYDHADAIRTDHQSSSMDIGGGVAARLSEAVALYASATYSGNIDSENQESQSGSIGLRISW